MRLRSFLTLAALLIASPQLLHAQSLAPNPEPPNEAYAGRVPGVVYVQFRAGYIPNMSGYRIQSVGKDAVEKIFASIGVRSIELFDPSAWKDSISHSLGIDRMYVVLYTRDVHPVSVVSQLLQTGLVQSASPRYIFKYQDRPNDPGFSEQYAMARIDAEHAWDLTHGDSSVVIADVDAGVNLHHEDLAANIKYNAGEIGTDSQGQDKRSNGKDDDGDGAIDNWRGWDAAGERMDGILAPDNDPSPEPIQFYGANHGTLTSGCFGAVANNQIGIAGVAQASKILAVKIGNGQEQLTGAYEGVHYASAHGAKVINCSWGGLVDRQALPFAETFAQEITARGQVMVAAAGNYSINNDLQHFYPAYIEDVLSVGASDAADKPSSFTHYGHSVDVFAPGVQVKSTDYPGSDLYNDVDGTSFSSPITAGVVALVMAKNPSLSPKQVQRRIIESCDNVLGKDRWLYWGRVNAFKALTSPGHPALEVMKYNAGGVDNGQLDPVDVSSNISIVFKNYAQPGLNVSAVLQPGLGYTWDNYDPAHPLTWPSKLIGTIDSQSTGSATFRVIRTGQISEGSIPFTFYLKDGSGYSDTARVSVRVTPKSGMVQKLTSPHATSIRQVNASIGWAGFGYYIRARNPEKGTDETILVSQFSKRSPDGTWSSPEDVGGGDHPITTVEAIDAEQAWFGANAPTGGDAIIYYTTDGGSTWNEPSVTLSNVRAIHFFDATHGVAIGDASSGKWQIVATDDGGATWKPGGQPSTSGTAGFFNGAAWVGDRGWFGSNNKEVFVSSDKGASWRAYAVTTLTAKEKNVAALGFSDDVSLGYALIRPYGTAADSAGIYYSQTNGLTWNAVPRPDPNLIPYSVAFIPGSTVAVMSSNLGVYKMTFTSGTVKWSYLGIPSSWDPRSSVLSASGSQTAYTIAGASQASGVADYAFGDAGVTPGSTEQSAFDMSVTPNPVQSSARAYVSASEASHLRLELRDVLGNCVASLYDGEIGVGVAAFPISAKPLPPGVYHLVATLDGGKVIERNVVVTR